MNVGWKKINTAFYQIHLHKCCALSRAALSQFLEFFVLAAQKVNVGLTVYKLIIKANQGVKHLKTPLANKHAYQKDKNMTNLMHRNFLNGFIG